LSRDNTVYLHTLRFVRKRNELYLPLPSQSQLVLIYPLRRDGRLSRPWRELAPAEIRTIGALIDEARLTSVAYIGPSSRTERPRKTKIGTEVAHVTRDSDTTFKVKRSKVELGRSAFKGVSTNIG